MVDQIFDFMVRDMSRFALQVHGKPIATEFQSGLCLQLIRRAEGNQTRFQRVLDEHVYSLAGMYEMAMAPAEIR